MTIFVYMGLRRNPEIRNNPSEFCPKSGEWGGGGAILAGMCLMKSYLMLQNASFTAFTASELLKENQWRIRD